MKNQTVLVVHGHFYQPPRENPWTDEVDDDPGAAPFSNWNERINAECYRSNAYARIHDGRNRIARMVNNFSCLSFNIGPTLGRWLDRHDKQVARRIREGNEEQRSRLSAGGAMAQVWAHPIAPLLSSRDRQTQILWGIQDFRRRFGYHPAGMWLPETAANEATLAALIDAGIAFTIVAPEQIRAVRPPNGNWQEVTADSVDTGRAYRFMHPDGSGRQLALCVFDGPLSRELAFGAAARDANTFSAAVQRSAKRSHVDGKRLLLAASDGELYGHHRKFSDLMLAYSLAVSVPSQGVQVSNLQAFLAESPPSWEARLHRGQNGEGTAWSCSHGLGRWLRDCGCRINHKKGSSQAWRTPLRQALDLLRDRSAELFESKAAECFADPWAARDDYGEVVDDGFEVRSQFLRERAKQPVLAADDSRRVLLMEMQRSLLLMYTSCAWFFDDIAGPEAGIALQQAAYAMDLWRRLGAEPPEQEFTALLGQARSNDPRLGTGADALARARRGRVTSEHVVAREAFAHLLDGKDQGWGIPGFRVQGEHLAGLRRQEKIDGEVEVTELRTGSTASLPFSACRNEDWQLTCTVGRLPIELGQLAGRWAWPLRLEALAKLAESGLDMRRARALLEGASKLGAEAAAAAAPVLVRALVDFLETLAADGRHPGDAEAELAFRLWEAAGSAQGEALRRLQDVVWEHLDRAHRHRTSPPKALQMLAERVAPLRAAKDGKANV
jgi:alpha-amylase/alpha-mannosidase (GH57 family)